MRTTKRKYWIWSQLLAFTRFEKGATWRLYPWRRSPVVKYWQRGCHHHRWTRQTFWRYSAKTSTPEPTTGESPVQALREWSAYQGSYWYGWPVLSLSSMGQVAVVRTSLTQTPKVRTCIVAKKNLKLIFLSLLASTQFPNCTDTVIKRQTDQAYRKYSVGT